MSRSGYSDDCDEGWGLWRGAVKSAITGKRGQAFLRELAAAMDAMPEKKLITDALEEEGCYCTLGVVGAARGLDMSDIDYEEPSEVASAFGISHAMAAEIEWINDECGIVWERELNKTRHETDEERWVRMRAWVERNIRAERPA